MIKSFYTNSIKITEVQCYHNATFKVSPDIGGFNESVDKKIPELQDGLKNGKINSTSIVDNDHIKMSIIDTWDKLNQEDRRSIIKLFQEHIASKLPPEETFRMLGYLDERAFSKADPDKISLSVSKLSSTTGKIKLIMKELEVNPPEFTIKVDTIAYDYEQQSNRKKQTETINGKEELEKSEIQDPSKLMDI